MWKPLYIFFTISFLQLHFFTTATCDVINVEVDMQRIRTKLKALWHPVSRYFWLKSDVCRFRLKTLGSWKTQRKWNETRDNHPTTSQFSTIYSCMQIKCEMIPLGIGRWVHDMILWGGEYCFTRWLIYKSSANGLLSMDHIHSLCFSYVLYLCIPLEWFIYHVKHKINADEINARTFLIHNGVLTT